MVDTTYQVLGRQPLMLRVTRLGYLQGRYDYRHFIPGQEVQTHQMTFPTHIFCTWHSCNPKAGLLSSQNHAITLCQHEPQATPFWNILSLPGLQQRCQQEHKTTAGSSYQFLQEALCEFHQQSWQLSALNLKHFASIAEQPFLACNCLPQEGNRSRTRAMSPTYFGTSGAENSVWPVVGIQ